MNNLMKYKGYFGSIEVSLEDGVIHGKLECINDLITYEASTVPDLKKAFEAAVDDYLETCEELGKKPEKTMSGTFNVRIGESLHKEAYLASKAKKLSLNDFVRNAIRDALNGKNEIHYHFEKPREANHLRFGSMKRNQEKPSWEAVFDKGTHH
ncbi:type II toxin-antitoxin system HicB family antitoxin [Pantoea sp. Acro-805]|jgi:predicted HicB family RNase H-like nuclease|uniref:Type II toxin-antitoxin system HicB family antitoxin n=2 Tax=Candidatus Pantoea formicae TaxID=2608355 RepID=A0ABX0QSC5_9GAMM|nr:type II toxin-antitoxin system HicB family antitoxin [Pantoea formicae]